MGKDLGSPTINAINLLIYDKFYVTGRNTRKVETCWT